MSTATINRSPSGKSIVQLSEFRAVMKELGYRVRTKTNTSFIAATVLDIDGSPINAGNALTPEHFEQHKAFFEYRNAHSVRDGDWIVTI